MWETLSKDDHYYSFHDSLNHSSAAFASAEKKNHCGGFEFQQLQDKPCSSQTQQPGFVHKNKVNSH